MEVRCVFRLHSGGRLSRPPFTVKAEVPRGALTADGDHAVPCITLARICCALLNDNNRLEVHNIQFAEVVNAGGWQRHDGDVVQLPNEQQELLLNVMVGPTAVDPGFQAQPMYDVRLIDLVQQPIPWFGSKSKSASSTDITYDNMTMSQQPWAPDILEYLRAELGTKTLGQDPDPRLTGGQIRTLTHNEDELNTQFQAHVCDLVALIVSRAKGIDVISHKNIESHQVGKPDYFFTINDDDAAEEVLQGEGKNPSVIRCAKVIDRTDGAVWKCARQEGFYIKQRFHSYGFLGCGQAIFGFARVGEDQYDISVAIPWYQDGAGVLAWLTYLVLKQLDIEVNNKHDSNIYVPTEKQLQQQQFALPADFHDAAGASSSAAAAAAAAGGAPEPAMPAAHHQLAQSQQEQWNAAAAAAAAEPPTKLAAPAAAAEAQHGQGASLLQRMTVSGSNSSSSSHIMQPAVQYLKLNEDDLYLSHIVLGKSEAGLTKLGMLFKSGIWCAVKLVDAHKQRHQVEALKGEYANYGLLVDLQDVILPVCVGCGYWAEGNVFFLATKYLECCKKPSFETRDARPAAEEALQQLHDRGLLHGDIHEGNVLLRQLSDGQWQAFFIDLGMCCEARQRSQFGEEMNSLKKLFRASDTAVT